MCVIAYKPRDARFPSRETLRCCWDGNRDGAGYMLAADGKVLIRKGFMDFESLMDALDAERAKHGDGHPYVIHFRIQTQGGVRRDCCHPFPISRDMDDLRLLRCKADIGVAHNGVIALTSEGMGSKATYSDTMSFITDYLSLIVKDTGWHRDRDKVELVDRLCGGRLAILGKDGHCELVGKWIKDQGIYYSNASYLNYGGYEVLEDLGWEDFRLPNGYDFMEDYCPLTVDGDFSYCESCLNHYGCQSLEQELMEAGWTG